MIISSSETFSHSLDPKLPVYRVRYPEGTGLPASHLQAPDIAGGKVPLGAEAWAPPTQITFGEATAQLSTGAGQVQSS
jgi:hypothetical protein